MIVRRFKNYLCMSGIGCLVAGAALAFIPLVDLNGSSAQRIFALIVAAVFWLGFTAEIIFFVFANNQCRKMENSLNKNHENTFKGLKPGIISFFKCREAAVADILSALSAIAVIVLIVLNISNDWLFTCVAVILFFSFNLHCFLNGKNYKYIKEYQKYLKKQGAKKDE